MKTISNYAAGIIINKKILEIVILSMLLAGLVSLCLPDIYVARAVVAIHYPRKTRPFAFMSEGSMQAQDLDLPTLSIKNCVNLLMSQGVLQEVIDKLGLDSRLKGGFTVKKLEGIVRVDPVKEISQVTDVIYAPAINLIVTYKDKALAKDIANCWAEVLIGKATEIDNKSLDNVLMLAEEHQGKLINKIEAQEELIRSISRDRGISTEERQIRLSHPKRDLEELRQLYALNNDYLNSINLLMIQKGVLRINIAARAIEPAKEDAVFPNRPMIIILTGLLTFLFSSFWFSLKRNAF